MSNRLFQNIIHQMEDCINDRKFGVIDDKSVVVACNELTALGDVSEVLFNDISNETDSFIKGGYTYKKFGVTEELTHAIFIEGEDSVATTYASLIAISLTNVKFYYDEKCDKSSFMKNVIMDNILHSDVLLKARDLHFDANIPRVVMLVRTASFKDNTVYDIIQNLFPENNKDFVININQTDVAIVKEISNNITEKDIESLAETIVSTLSSEFFIHSYIGIGTVANDLTEVTKSYKEAQLSLEVGKVFDSEHFIVSYSQLGIARLIYQLPTAVCEAFLTEVFNSGRPEILDQETLSTVQCFFENNLNVSATSSALFVHRNTLVYRLDKIKKITGLDLKEFDQAVIFKIALMVQKYLKASPIKF